MENLRIELWQSNPEYPTQLKQRKKDMEKSDHGIVIAGLILFCIKIIQVHVKYKYKNI